MRAGRLRVIVLAGVVIFNIAAWRSASFADRYTDSIFPLWGRTLGRFMSLFPFSVGEWAIIFGLTWLAVLLVSLILWGLSSVLKKGAKRRGRAAKGLLVRTADLLLGIAVVMSLNCFVLYHCTPLDTRADKRSYSLTELSALRDMIVTECNSRAALIPRDDGGEPVFSGDMRKEAAEAVNALGERLFPRLSGYSVTPKTFYFSDFVSQQHMMGYYFPFTMEANINGRMETLNMPFTMCHELAHTHGYIYEDEANLIGFLACLSSDDPVFVYSGYLGVLIYVNNDFYTSAGKKVYAQHVAVDGQVWKDAQFLSDESWAQVEEHAVLDTELVHSAADTFIDQNQKLNGVSSGKASYSHVVALLLSYYSGEAEYLGG